MELDLFAGMQVSDYEAAKPWYERLLGSEPTFLAYATEAVWELAEHRFLFIVERPKSAGGAMHTVFVEDLDAVVAEIGSRVGVNARLSRPARADGSACRGGAGRASGASTMPRARARA
jgi:hypothetical protein